MTEELVLEIFREALILAIKIAGPMLLISMLVGLVIAILQAATQVHEQTLSFAPKAVIVALALLILGPWMINSCIEFMTYIFDLMASVGAS